MGKAAVYKSEIKQLCHTLIHSDIPIDVLNASDALFNMLFELSGYNPNSDELKANKTLQYGTAIGPYWAAYCIKDIKRTQKFLRGILAAIRDVTDKHCDNKTVEILYAGTGPFASLALPIIMCYPELNLKFTFIEIHEETYKILTGIVKLLEIDEFVRETLFEDACTYTIPENLSYDIVISETMQHALEREPQVALYFNLAHQTDENTIFIPQQVKVSAALYNQEKDTKIKMGLIPSSTKCIAEKKTIFSLDKTALIKLWKKYKNLNHIKIEKSYEIAEKTVSTFPFLILYTEIRIYEQYKLSFRDTALCAPKIIADFKYVKSLPYSVVFRYNTDQMPGFKTSFS
jgi:predicted RNA methylase